MSKRILGAEEYSCQKQCSETCSLQLAIFFDVTPFRRSSSITKPNFIDIPLSTHLRYNYFRFGKIAVRRIAILLQVLILTISPYSACYSICITRIRLPNFVQIGPSSSEKCYIDFEDGGCWGAILLPVLDRVTSLFFGCLFLSANQIS